MIEEAASFDGKHRASDVTIERKCVQCQQDAGIPL
jgi:hypothetical protein